MSEGAPVNSAGGGNIAGIGVGPKGEPGRPKKYQSFSAELVREVLRRTLEGNK